MKKMNPRNHQDRSTRREFREIAAAELSQVLGGQPVVEVAVARLDPGWTDPPAPRPAPTPVPWYYFTYLQHPVFWKF